MLFSTYGIPEWLRENGYLDKLIHRRKIQGGGVIWSDISTKSGDLQEKAGIINVITRRPGHVTGPGKILHNCHSLRLHTEMKK